VTWLASSPTALPHLVLEALAYFVGARVYWVQARRTARPPGVDGWLLLGGGLFGAAVGSKGLHALEHLPVLLERNELSLWLGGKSVLGGFLGGTLGVELAKKAIGWKRSTGDAWVPALAVGLALGRLGCQLSGLWDQTYGLETTLPWAWDHGDGVGRHPVALYEALAVLGLWALVRPRWPRHPGATFAAFLVGYCALRFGLEFLKPPFGPAAAGTLPATLWAGLSAIQWAALGGLLAYAALWRHRVHSPA
jgi:phosphatidylglycerol:prolipoprotein diacylglycerol transferase